MRLPPQTMLFGAAWREGRLGLRDRFWLARQMRHVDRMVREHGWVPVPFQLPHDQGPRHVYTVGFDETLDEPELIMFDTPYEAAAAEFMFAFAALNQARLELEDGKPWLEDACGRCMLRKVHPSRIQEGWLGLAMERRRRLKGSADGLEAYQLVLTDRANFYPWEAGYDESARIWQPALYEPADADG